MLYVIHFALCKVLTFSLKILRVSLFQFCINFLVKIFPVNILYLGKCWEFLNGSCFVLFPDMSSISAVLNLWAAAHWWAADLSLMGRVQGWELRIFVDVSHVSQSMERYQVLVVELKLPLHT